MGRELTRDEILSLQLKEKTKSQKNTWSTNDLLNSNEWIDYQYKGEYNPETNVPDLFSEETEVKKYFTYIIQCDGLFVEKELKKGDIIIAMKDEPKNDLDNWKLVFKNIENGEN